MTLKRVVPAGLLALALSAGACTRPPEAQPPATPTAPTTVASPASSVDVSGWQAFTSVAGGYRLRYPPGWRVKEATGSGGPVLSLLPPTGDGISVLVTLTPPDAGGARPPDTQCRPVRVGRLQGSRCLNTASMVVSTTLQGRERWYLLTTTLRRPDGPAAGAYDQVVASLRPR